MLTTFVRTMLVAGLCSLLCACQQESTGAANEPNGSAESGSGAAGDPTDSTTQSPTGDTTTEPAGDAPAEPAGDAPPEPADTTPDGAKDENLTPSDEGYVEGDGYRSGAYLCCAKGEGTACCGDSDPGTCFQYGGFIGDCGGPGNTVEGKDICAHCCKGLDRVSILEKAAEPGPGVDENGCIETGPPSLFVCVA